jgi:hypothetical protein
MARYIFTATITWPGTHLLRQSHGQVHIYCDNHMARYIFPATITWPGTYLLRQSHGQVHIYCDNHMVRYIVTATITCPLTHTGYSFTIFRVPVRTKTQSDSEYCDSSHLATKARHSALERAIYPNTHNSSD